MPDLADLRDAFDHLARQIPDRYHSPLLEDRMTELLQRPGGHQPLSAPHRPAPANRPRSIGAALLAAAVVAALAVTVVLVRGPAGSPAPVGTQPTAASSAPPVSGSATSAQPTPSTDSSSGPAPVATMPVSATALVAFVEGGSPAAIDDYQQGATASGQPMRPTAGIIEFTTPSGNIACGLDTAVPGGGAASALSLACVVTSFAGATPPKPSSCTLNWAPSWFSIENGRVTRGLCLGGPPFDPISPALPYGSTLRSGELACRSDAGFLACVDLTTRHGFAVNRTTATTY
jgi:hypothetical protein